MTFFLYKELKSIIIIFFGGGGGGGEEGGGVVDGRTDQFAPSTSSKLGA